MPAVKPAHARTYRVGILSRRAEIASVPEGESRTFRVVWSTGARGVNIYFGEEIVDANGKRVERPERWSLFEEELSLDEAHVRLEQLQTHGPLVDGHSIGSMGSVYGAVRSAWIEGGKAWAECSVRPGEKGDEILAGLRSGDLRSFSVGYRVQRFLDVTPPNAKIRRLRAIDWTPYEISLVPIPFDKGVGVRSEGPMQTVEIVRDDHQNTMDEELDENGQPIAPVAQRSETPTEPQVSEEPAPAPQPAPAPDRSRATEEQTRLSERARIAAVTRLSQRYGRDEAFTARAINEGWDERRTREEIILAREEEDLSTSVQGRHRAQVGEEHLTKLHKAAADALAKRLDSSHKAEFKDLLGARMDRIGEELLRARGIPIESHRPSDLAKQILGFGRQRGVGAHSTSDFPKILADVAEKRALKLYQTAPATFEPWTQDGTVSDFKPSRRVRLSDAPALLEKPQLAKYDFGSMGEESAEIRVKNYGRMVPVSWEVLVNDDLNTFSGALTQMGMRARQLEGDLVYNLLAANPTMDDGVALFHASHNNLGSGVIGETALAAAFNAMRKQTAPGGTHLNLEPAYIMVPPELQWTARKQLLENITPATAANTNPWRGLLQIVVDSRLSASSTTAWYLAANPSLVDTIELAKMTGEEEPSLEEKYDWEQEAILFRVRHVVGVAALDFRGLYKSTGV